MNHELTNTAANRVFVYGTLMKGQRAHHFLEGCTPLGTWILRDYAMYNLKNYPGIQKKEGKSVVGEVYIIPESFWEAMDRYEDEGTLYHRRTVTVMKGEEQMEVQAYIYAREVDPNSIMDGPWNSI